MVKTPSSLISGTATQLYLLALSLEGGMPAKVQPGEVRYVQRVHEMNGDEVLTLGRVSGVVWACLYPDGSVRTLPLNMALVFKFAKDDIAWVLLPARS